MLSVKTVAATVAVKDLEAAKAFYEGKLGLEETETDGENYIAYKSGESELLVYQSQFAGGYNATVATWDAGDDVESVVKDLKQKGVTFEHYSDLPDTKLKGDVHISGDMQMAWCKDPDGNILAFVGTAGNA
jgi:catechol 2,3-dioxygenase-like lactoylglutathione lyase family enzyme